jgi:hypothetical protein
MNSAPASSSLPPISPTMRMPSVAGSSSNNASTSTKFMPRTGSPPMPTQVLWPRPLLVVWNTASYVSVPERDTMPILPFLWMKPGMMPILHSSGVMTPGQFGPTSRDFESRSTALTLTMSLTGMPSVMQTISSMPASSASRIASAAYAPGT